MAKETKEKEVAATTQEIAEDIEKLNEEIEAVTEEIEAVTEKAPKKNKKEADPAAELKELAPVRLLKDRAHTDDVIVRVNGYAYQIQRGKLVNVPKYIKEVLDHKELQEQEALDRSLEMQIDPNDKAFL